MRKKGRAGLRIVWLAIGLSIVATTAGARMAETNAKAWNHYFGRNGHTRDYAKALTLFQQGATRDFAKSHYGLATLYSRGLGVELDYSRARYHYEKAAQGGVRRAYYNLGVLHHKGLGVAQNDVRARELFETAAEMGEPHAYLTLGIFDEEGLGGSVALESAMDWYRKATAEGVAGAQERLDKLMRKRNEGER